MMAAGLLAKKAVEKGLKRKPWVKTSLAPGSRVVTEYYRNAGLIPYLEKLGFNDGLWMHHVHRKFRPAAAGRFLCHHGKATGRGFRAFRQSQL